MPDTSESLYEQLFPLTTVMKQRFVDNFSGDALDTDRWSTNDTGSGSTATYTMADEVDGGLKITSTLNGASTLDWSPTDSTKKRPFNNTGSVMIVTSKLVQANYAIMYCNLRSNHYTEAGSWIGYIVQGVTNGNSGDNKIRLNSNISGMTSVDTSLSSSVLYDWHTYKLTVSSGTTTLSVDGILSGTGFATGSGNPTTRLHPALVSSASEGATSSGATTYFRYVECYNT